MRVLLLLFSMVVVIAVSCDKDPITPDGSGIIRDTIPAGFDTSRIHPCVLEKIDYLEARGAAADTTAIMQFYYNGQLVYLYFTECCDRYNVLYDSSCQMICLPTGGLSGGGDGSCPDFADRAVYIKKIWQKY